VAAVDVEVTSDGQWPDELGHLLRGLPEWFGIESSVSGYVDAARTLPSFAALLDGEVVGVCVVRHHHPLSSEIEVLAVRRDLHRFGIGRRLVDAVEEDLRVRGTKLLQVKTRGPSAPSAEYERTRAFYEAIGFIPLEERFDIWDADNPCLIMVKPLG
jgi:ribosomal protein S18 acetylase RimI-like enzyme